MNPHYSADNPQPTSLFPPRTTQQESDLSWTTFQIAISILCIGLLGGLMLGCFYGLFLGFSKGLVVGLSHGFIAGSIWVLIWYCKWSDV